jgi:hypothetical protein
MNTSQGTVEVVTSKPLASGKGTMYNFKLADGVWYGLGFKQPAFTKGAFIKFSWTANGNFKNADFNSIEVVEGEAPAVAAAPATAAPAAKATNWDEKDKRITLLACRKDAIALVQVAIETGAVSLGAAKNKKLSIMTEAVNQIAAELYYSIYGQAYPLHEPVPAPAEAVNDSEE